MGLDKDKPKFEVADVSKYVLSGIVRTKACRESTELLTVREEVGGNYLCNDDEYTEFVFKEAEEVPPHEEIKATDDAIRVEEVFGNKNCVELKEFKNDSTDVAGKDETLNPTDSNEPAVEAVKERLESTDSAACEVVKKKVPDEPDEEPPDEESKIGGVGAETKISHVLFILLYDCVGLVSGFIDV